MWGAGKLYELMRGHIMNKKGAMLTTDFGYNDLWLGDAYITWENVLSRRGVLNRHYYGR